ncbi:hypothetical protein D3C76_720680 [compost metagenome]
MSPAELSVRDHLAQGGLITVLDYAGNVTGWHSGAEGDQVAIVSPSVLKLTDAPRRAEPSPSAIGLADVILASASASLEERLRAQLVGIRKAARRALARLDRAFPRAI